VSLEADASDNAGMPDDGGQLAEDLALALGGRPLSLDD
jgi:hypothetical protein